VGHELSVALVGAVVEVVVTWAVSLVLEARTGADTEAVVCVADGDEVWLAVTVLVVMTGVLDGEAVNVTVDVLADMDGVTTVVTTMIFVVGTKFCVEVATTVTAEVMTEVAAEEGMPIRSVVSMLWQLWVDRVNLHPTVAQTSPGIQQPPPMSLAQGLLPATH
jgi:hypothetical protein